MSRRGTPVRLTTVGLSCLAAALLLFVSGCGVSKGDLSGTVTSGGKPVCSGSVRYVTSDGASATAIIQDNGTYSFSNVPAGELKLAVTSPDASAAPVTVGKYGKSTPPPKDPKWFSIPDKYGQPETSGITFTLDKAVNTFDIKVD